MFTELEGGNWNHGILAKCQNDCLPSCSQISYDKILGTAPIFVQVGGVASPGIGAQKVHKRRTDLSEI